MNLHANLSDQLREYDRLEAIRKAELNADYSKADRHEFSGWITTQGRLEQAWPARRCSPELHVIDALPEDYDQGERTGRHRRMGVLRAWERGLLLRPVRSAIGWLSFMALVVAGWKVWG